jgi:putative YphP/YqiW family bacilliredoxin
MHHHRPSPDFGKRKHFTGMAVVVEPDGFQRIDLVILWLILNRTFEQTRRRIATQGDLMYPEEMVTPMRHELVQAGFKEWRSAAEVDRDLGSAKGVTLVVINSVCGCSAASCRPGVALAMQTGAKPDHAYTVFAGNDIDAVSQVREHLLGEPPSSPSMGIFKDGKFHGMIHRKDIQGRHPHEIAVLVQEAIAAAKAA